MNTQLSAPLQPNALPAGLPGGVRFSGDVSNYVNDRSGRQGAVPLGAVHCSSIDDLEKVIHWANRASVALVPMSSRGGPRRRGDTVSPRPALIVDLSGMNRVINIDGRDAVAVIEAGVTFAEFASALKPHGLKPFSPLMPRASKSVLTAFLEREPTMVPGRHWDSADPLGALEFIFGSGDRFRTGGAALPGTIEENIARGNRQLLNSGPGQTDFGRMVQGSQGSLAIVARGSVMCDRIPAVSQPLFVTAASLSAVVSVAYAMLRKRHDGKLLLVNDVQLALILAAKDPSIFMRISTLPQWSLYVELTATKHFAEEAIRYRRADLEVAAAAAGATVSQQIGGHAAAVLAELLDAAPVVPYKNAAGRSHEEVFFLTQLDRVQSLLDALAGSVASGDMAVYLQPMTQGVNAHCEFTFFAAGESEVRSIARKAAERLAGAGAFFSRPYHLWADLAFARDPQIVHLLEQIKELFDPNGVLQPQSQALGASPAFTGVVS